MLTIYLNRSNMLTGLHVVLIEDATLSMVNVIIEQLESYPLIFRQCLTYSSRI